MKKDYSFEDSLFATLRSSKPELSVTHIEKMVTAFPITAPGFDWTQIINLNNVLMTSLGTIIISGIMILSADEGITASNIPAPSVFESEYANPMDNEACTPLEEWSSNHGAAVSIPTQSPKAIEVEHPLEPLALIIPSMDISPIEIPLETAPVPPVIAEDKTTFEVGEFHSVSIMGAFEVIITQGDEYAAWADGEKDQLNNLKVTSDGDKLSIKTEGKNKNNCSKTTTTVYITMPDVKNLTVAGSAELTIGKFTGLEDVSLSIAGSGDIAAEEGLEMSGKIYCSISGSGDMNIDGTAEAAKIKIAGSGSFHGLDLRVQKAEVDIAGSGDASIHAEQALVVDIAGSGDVEYIGNPTLDKRVYGSGSVYTH